MRQFIFLLTIFVYFPSYGESKELNNKIEIRHSPSHNENYRILKKLKYSESNSHAWIVVREVDHIAGQPFQVELRVQCPPLKNENQTDILAFPVNDSFSVCALSAESIVVNSSGTAIAMKTKLVDMTDYSNQTLLANPDDFKPRCARETRLKTFSLENLCEENENRENQTSYHDHNHTE